MCVSAKVAVSGCKPFKGSSSASGRVGPPAPSPSAASSQGLAWSARSSCTLPTWRAWKCSGAVWYAGPSSTTCGAFLERLPASRSANALPSDPSLQQEPDEQSPPPLIYSRRRLCFG
uniref:Uncharacterized protein n=1 Tax=uncultured marine microorganism HF4000_APKG7H23 TaxID=455551 RepID=B3T9T2_9ZZZZ|nr:hypothetical protein ALOHA_HF4000APKG7H23ctg3g6 [uncultured marine microorganism HF4000_APKG7H23]